MDCNVFLPVEQRLEAATAIRQREHGRNQTWAVRGGQADAVAGAVVAVLRRCWVCAKGRGGVGGAVQTYENSSVRLVAGAGEVMRVYDSLAAAEREQRITSVSP